MDSFHMYVKETKIVLLLLASKPSPSVSESVIQEDAIKWD